MLNDLEATIKKYLTTHPIDGEFILCIESYEIASTKNAIIISTTITDLM
ncbi:MAG: hypothetical protein ACKVPJ_10225 [Chitinophagales bacterium]